MIVHKMFILAIKMSNFSKRKRLMDQILGQEIETLTEKQSIVKIVRSKGNNLHEVSTIFNIFHNRVSLVCQLIKTLSLG
jgi:hypothetical protein